MASTTTDVIDGVSTSTAIKAPCRLATTANITLSGLQTIDSIAGVADDRCLVKDQTDATENGIYLIKSTAWVRAVDFDGARDVKNGTLVKVQEGTVNGYRMYEVYTADPITIGTSSITFRQYGPLATHTITYLSDYASFDAAVTAIGATESTLVIDVDATVSANLTIPATMTLDCLQGNVIAISSGFTLTINGSLNANLFQIFSGLGSVRFAKGITVYPEWWGAVGVDGTDDDTVAIQDAFDSLAQHIVFTGYYGISQITLLDLSGTIVEGRSNASTGGPSKLKYLSGASGTGAMINLSTVSAGYGASFKNLIFDTNDTAQYGFYLASVGSFQAIKDMVFENVDVNNLKAGAVGWQIGDQTNTTLDTDAYNYNFRDCKARGTGAYGWVIDAANAYNISWYDCANSRKDGSNFMLTGIKTIRGSGFRLYNYFGDKLQASGTPWVIDHASGSLEVYGMNTEDYRVLKARTIGRDDDKAVLHGVSVNDTDGADEAVIDSTMDLAVYDSTLQTLTSNRKITCTNSLTLTNTEIGSTGVIDVSSEPRRLMLDGIRVGTLTSLCNNSIFNMWVATGADQPPISWALNKGTGTATIQQATTNAVQGQYTVDIDCSVANTGDVMGIVMSREIPIAAYRGTAINIVAIATRVATESIEVECLVDSVDVMTGGTTVYEAAASGGQIMAWGRIDVPTTAIKINASSIKVGLPSGSTGRVYIDCVAIIPVDFTGRIPSLFHHVRNLNFDAQLEGLKVNNIQMNGYTMWIDNTGDVRVLVGNRATDTDGTVVGTQT